MEPFVQQWPRPVRAVTLVVAGSAAWAIVLAFASIVA